MPASHFGIVEAAAQSVEQGFDGTTIIGVGELIGEIEL
jgi:hypothetical protein